MALNGTHFPARNGDRGVTQTPLNRADEVDDVSSSNLVVLPALSLKLQIHMFHNKKLFDMEAEVCGSHFGLMGVYNRCL